MFPAGVAVGIAPHVATRMLVGNRTLVTMVGIRAALRPVDIVQETLIGPDVVVIEVGAVHRFRDVKSKPYLSAVGHICWSE